MTKREICERLISIHNRLFHEYAMADGMEDIDVESIGKDIGSLILDLAAPETEEKPVQEPKSKFPIGHPLHMSTEEIKAADTALFTQTGGRMGKDWRNAEEKKEPPIPERPLLWVDGNAPLEPCPKCGTNCPKLDERTSGLPGAYHYCQSCHAYFVPKRGCAYRIKRGKDEK